MNKNDKIFRKRLFILARKLRTGVPRKRFRMKKFFIGNFFGRPDEARHTECSSCACAVGWACTIPSFQRDGLEVDTYGVSSGWISQIPIYQGERAIAASVAFFGLHNDREFEYLFGPHWPNSPVQAAQRIERFLKDRSVVTSPGTKWPAPKSFQAG